jgi:rubredoxin-NAD+ reductase
MTDSTIDPNYRIDWYRTPIDRDHLSELNARSDLKGFVQSGGYLGACIASGALAWLVHVTLPWPWLIPAVLLHGTVCSFTINAVHELVHGTVFETKKLNDIFAAIFAFFGWHNHFAFWASHSEHHKFTLHDPHDQEVLVPISITLGGCLRSFTLDFPALKWTLQLHTTLARGKCESSWGQYLYGEDPRRFGIFNWSRFILAGHALIVILSFATGNWLIPVLTTLTPLYGKGLFFLLNTTQHVGLQDHVSDFRLNSRSFNTNPVFRFLYWHMNWHIEHHMYAAVPCYNLKKLHREVRSDLPYVWNGLTEMWFHIITCLYRQKYEPGYMYVPEIPGGDRPKDLNTRTLDRTGDPGADPGKPPVAAELPDAGPDGEPWRLWECAVCGFIYDERLGLPEENIAPGTRWEEIPDDWRCPDCGVAKADFDMVKLTRGTASASATSFDVVTETGPIVIVGSGLAAYTLVREYRKLNRKRVIRVLTRDNGDFYYKPSLSNALSEKHTPDTLVLKPRAIMEKELGITVTAACEVQKIDRDAKQLHTSAGEIPYGKLVLAQGAAPIRIPLEGDAADQVVSINDLADYHRFRDRLEPGARVLIMGAGLVGCEFANDLASAGYRTTVSDLADLPLARLTPPEIGRELKSALESEGVVWRLGTGVQRVNAGENGSLVAGLDTGEKIEVDLVLSAVGLAPRTQLAESAGLDVNRAIATDAFMRTSDPGIFALGDCADCAGKPRPYVLPITHAAKAIALTLAGTQTEVCWPAMPVTVKTPALPLYLLPPEKEGSWDICGEAPDLEALHLDANGNESGFVLSGQAVHRKREALKC